MPKVITDEDDAEVSTVGTPTQDDISEVDMIVDEDDIAAEAEPRAVTRDVSKPIVRVRVRDELRRTTNQMTISTAAALIAIRTRQIGQFGNSIIDSTPYATNEDVARAELLEGKCPLILKKCVGKREKADCWEYYYEYFNPSEMILPRAFTRGAKN